MESVLRCYKGFSVGQSNDALCFRVRMRRRTNRGRALSMRMKEMQNIWVSVLKNKLNVEYIVDNPVSTSPLSWDLLLLESTFIIFDDPVYSICIVQKPVYRLAEVQPQAGKLSGKQCER